MSDRSWKKSEREVAVLMGNYRRRAVNGLGSPDIDAGPWAVEVKTRKRLPSLIHEAHEQAKRNAKNKTPLVVMCERRQGVKTRRYVMMEMSDWLQWFGPTGWARGVTE